MSQTKETAPVIRPVTKQDRNMLMAFFDQMAGDTRSMFNRGDVNRERAERYCAGNTEHELQFAAVVPAEGGGEEMIGYVFLWDTDKLVPWLGIAVAEHWKGRHYGRVLLAHLDDVAKQLGCGGLLLTTCVANLRAQGLYTRMGYEFMGTHTSGEYLYIKRFSNGGKS